uniref:Uncharacterized protein n=1 Tax=Cucumis melo TaxID=3656 RepID=A0A9I9EKR2_CUCME
MHLSEKRTIHILGLPHLSSKAKTLPNQEINRKYDRKRLRTPAALTKLSATRLRRGWPRSYKNGPLWVHRISSTKERLSILLLPISSSESCMESEIETAKSGTSVDLFAKVSEKKRSHALPGPRKMKNIYRRSRRNREIRTA